MNLDTALRQMQAAGLERLDSQLLLLLALGTPAVELHARRSWLLAHGDDPLPEATAAALATLAQRRLDGEPLAYLAGHKEFHGLGLLVDARVLVPRPDTETLVDWALEVLQPLAGAGGTLQALDLGTGSGAIALALRHRISSLEMDAVDASQPALEVARHNAEHLALPLRLLHGSWFGPVAGQRYHCIVSNPPYIRSEDPHLQALAHEPTTALVAGPDGLADIRNIIDHAMEYLHPGGWLLLEHGYDQAQAVRALLLHAGFGQVQSRQDLAGHERCSGGCASPQSPHGSSRAVEVK